MNKKRILYCDSNTDGTIGGSYFSLFYLVDGLDKSKYEPLVVFYTDNSLIPMYRNAGINVQVFPVFKPTSLRMARSGFYPLKMIGSLFQSAINFIRFFLGRALTFRRFIKENKIDMVHLNNSILRSHNWMFAAKLAGIKVVSHERGLNSSFPFLARFFAKRIDAILCISDAVKENFHKHKVKSKNFYKVYNGLDPDRVTVKKKREEILSQFECNDDSPVVGIVGNIKSWKGQDVVLNAIVIAKKTIPTIKCLLVGDTAESDKGFKEKLDKIIAEHDLHDNVIFTGYQSNVPDFMNSMDVVIHASTLGEPFGRVLLEAMALRKPLIGADGGAVPEIIVDGETGFLFKTGDHVDLAEKLLRLLTDIGGARQMGEKGYARLVEHYHIMRNVEKTQQLYEEILTR